MRLKEIFCPFCGERTKIDEDKNFSFCLECGSKIENLVHNNSFNSVNNFESEGKECNQNNYLNEKLKEVDFYLGLSKEKNEYLQLNYEPTYFIKAQDILLELSEQFPNEYKIWWELCKPLDFDYPSSSGDTEGRLSINEVYFNKALDLAKLENKKDLIIAHDDYIEEKRKFVSQRTIEHEKKEKEEERKRVEEERRRLEEERKRNEETRKIEEEVKKERKKEELKKQEEIQIKNSILWENLKNKEYDSINESYFRIEDGGGTSIVGVFKLISNILYLISYRQDRNGFIADQTIGIRFDSNGIVCKFDNKPIKIKDSGLEMQLLINNKGDVCMNEYQVIKDTEYIKKLIMFAKKPIISFRKTFF